jgi:DNA processing protein
MGWDMDKKPKQQQTQLFLDLSPEEIRLIELLQNKEQMSLDVIALKSEFPVSKVSTLLLQLEFMAVVKQLPGQRYSLIC